MESMKYQRLKHAPGYLSVYSNDGFTMVENLVKAVTGRSYPDYRAAGNPDAAGDEQQPLSNGDCCLTAPMPGPIPARRPSPIPR